MWPIPILFIDASTLFRKLAAGVLQRHFASRIMLAAVHGAWHPAEVSVLEPQPQVVLLGLGADGMLDPALLNAIQQALPGIPVVILGYLDDDAYSSAALTAGAAAFISKDSLHTELLPVLHQVVARPSEIAHWRHP
ncbi:response regulator transcription factor [Candidatus Viridilinea mediisalina]|nr:response regulator transcription factor [Candidatus Viridilinea mediisalina]